MSEVASFRAFGDLASVVLRTLKAEVDKQTHATRQRSQQNR